MALINVNCGPDTILQKRDVRGITGTLILRTPQDTVTFTLSDTDWANLRDAMQDADRQPGQWITVREGVPEECPECERPSDEHPREGE